MVERRDEGEEMKFKFTPNREPKLSWKDWVEETKNTPSDDRASFFLREFREWMLEWVFK